MIQAAVDDPRLVAREYAWPTPTFVGGPFHFRSPLFMANSKMAQNSTKPVQVFRLRGISVSVFANVIERDDRDVTYHKVALQRTYREGNEFKTTSSLGRDDLPIAQMLLQRAWEFILNAEANRGKEESDVGE